MFILTAANGETFKTTNIKMLELTQGNADGCEPYMNVWDWRHDTGLDLRFMNTPIQIETV